MNIKHGNRLSRHWGLRPWWRALCWWWSHDRRVWARVLLDGPAALLWSVRVRGLEGIIHRRQS